MAITIITKNSVTASKRPTAAQLITGELGLNAEASDPGLYFEDSAGNIRKIGGCHYGATAPNVAAAGQVGNSVGELWYSTVDTKLYVWDGATWTVAGGTDTQAFYLAGPWATGVNRPDGTPLLAGDEWYDTSTTPAVAYVWDGAAWVFASNDTHALIFDGGANGVNGNPLTRPDGSAIQVGDIWYDSTTLESFIYYDDGTSAQWVQQIAPNPNSGSVSSVNITGANGIVVSGSPITSSGTISLSIDVNALPPIP